MELLLKRNEKPGAFGTRFDLFAKLELEAEELSRVRKAKPGKITILGDDTGKSQWLWRLCLIPSAIVILITLGILVQVFPIFMIIGLPVAIIAWIPVTKLLFNQFRPVVTIADLITGRTIHCKSLDELLVKEEGIREKTKNYCRNLEALHSLGNEQRIDLSRS